MGSNPEFVIGILFSIEPLHLLLNVAIIVRAVLMTNSSKYLLLTFFSQLSVDCLVNQGFGIWEIQGVMEDVGAFDERCV